jgi:hypothetical protein
MSNVTATASTLRESEEDTLESISKRDAPVERNGPARDSARMIARSGNKVAAQRGR